ncbi:MAG: zinc ribbon domain-containing protein [Anaerolineales bacterium]
MNQAFQLFRLQQVDTQLDQAHARLREIDSILKNDATVRAAEEALAKATQELEGAKKELRKAEENTKNQRQKIKHTDEQLYGGKVRNPKELQDLQKESEALGRYLLVLEERQLEAMLVVEDATQSFEAAQKNLNMVRARQIETQSALHGERRQITQQAKQWLAERQATASSIPQTDLSHYDQLRKRRTGIAVAKVTDKSCSACGTELSTSYYQAALVSKELHHCETCGRILYVG